MKLSIRILLMTVFLAAGFAAGFPAGRSIGFATGSEWALVQAELLARESGLDMPVSFDGEQFRIVMKQPRRFYSNARALAARHDDEMARRDQTVKCLISLNSTTNITTHIAKINISNE